MVTGWVTGVPIGVLPKPIGAGATLMTAPVVTLTLGNTINGAAGAPTTFAVMVTPAVGPTVPGANTNAIVQLDPGPGEAARTRGEAVVTPEVSGPNPQ